MAVKKPSLLGRWRITHMDEWDQDYVDAEVKAFIYFGPDGLGEFQFGYVSGGIDYRLTERDGQPAIEWSWDGNAEMDPAQGRGWAVLQSDGRLSGRLFLHLGDDSAFTARKLPVRKGRANKKKKPPKKPPFMWLPSRKPRP